MFNFEEYMESKIPNYKTKLEIHEIIYLKQLFTTYSNPHYEEKSQKRAAAQKALDNAINSFMLAKQIEKTPNFKRK